MKGDGEADCYKCSPLEGASMKVRLIKPGVSVDKKESDRQSAEVPVIDTIRSWVREFESNKINRARLDFERLMNRRKA
jgi:hypothetical protein